VPELRNVIVFAIGAARYAVELRWVREVVTILPVLDVSALLDQPPGAPARQGDGALVIEAEGIICGLRVDQVDHVATLPERAGESGAVVDAAGRPLTLLDPQRLLRRAVELVNAAIEPATVDG
jgi:chemotaxis signal transduction protein